jgi:hypothetical protein
VIVKAASVLLMIILLVLDKKRSPMAAASLWVIEVSIDGS